MKLKTIASTLLIAGAFFLTTTTVNAQANCPYPGQAECSAGLNCACVLNANGCYACPASNTGNTGVNAAVNLSAPTGTITNFGNLISGAVTVIFFAAGLIAFIYLLLGGIKWITSGGDTGKVEEARSQIIQALIGVVVVLAAWALIVLIQEMTGACFGLGCPIDFKGAFQGLN